MKYPRNVLTLILIVVIALWSVPVGAVLTEYTVLGSKGEPVPNTEVTIFDEKGTEIGKKKTDDKGVLVYDFPGKGKYDLKWPGGSQTVNIPGFWTPTNIGIATGLGLVGGVVAVSSGGGGGGGSTTPPVPPAPVSTVPSSTEIPGTYSLSGTETSDPCNIGYATISNSGVLFTASNGTVNINSSATMTGSYNSSTGSYTGSGVASYRRETFNGTFRKNGNITATGTLTFEHLSGSYPGYVGCIYTYNATYTKN